MNIWTGLSYSDVLLMLKWQNVLPRQVRRQAKRPIVLLIFMICLEILHGFFAFVLYNKNTKKHME